MSTTYPPNWPITGNNNTIDHAAAKLDNLSIKITGNDNRIVFADQALLANTNIVIAGDRHTVRIGAHCQLRNSWIWIEDADAVLDIGDQTTAEGAAFAITEPGSKITVGRDCMFSYGIDLRTGDSHSILDAVTGQRINFAEDIVLADHVWVGAHARILKGVHIAEHSIVATAAVVVRPEPKSHVILAGNPAKVVKEGINWVRPRLPRPT